MSKRTRVPVKLPTRNLAAMGWPADVPILFVPGTPDLPFPRNGTTTNLSAVVTGLSKTSDLTAGMGVTGTGVPANTTILTVDSASQITLSANATASATNLLSFWPKTVSNKGTLGPATFNLSDPVPQNHWVSTNGKLKAATSQGLYEAANPENAALMNKLYFFRNCSSPGIGGNILLVAFRVMIPTGATTPFLLQTGHQTAGGTNHAGWAIQNNTAGSLNLIRADDALTTGPAVVTFTADVESHFVFVFDAKNATVYIWKDGVPVGLLGADIATMVGMMTPFVTGDYDGQGHSLSLMNKNISAEDATPGTRTFGSNFLGGSMADVVIADITSRNSVLADRKDKIALALYQSPRGALSRSLFELLAS